MPHITVDYSPTLDGSFDPPAFVHELHPLVVERSGSLGVCKMYLRPASATYFGDPATPQAAFVHVRVGLLPGRSEEVKAGIAEEALDLLTKHLAVPLGDVVVCSSEVYDLPTSYRLRYLPEPPAVITVDPPLAGSTSLSVAV